MRLLVAALTSAALLALTSCVPRSLSTASGPLPPNTVLLSTMMQQLSSQPGFTEKFLAVIEGQQKKQGAAILTPALVHELRNLILGHNWQGLDRFPGWTMDAINPTVRVVGHLAGKDEKVGSLATAGGAPSKNADEKAALALIDLGNYGLGDSETVDLNLDLDHAPAANRFNPADYTSAVGAGVVRGDGPDPALAPLHAQSARLADVMNRLSLNGTGHAAVFRAAISGRTVSTPQDLIAALEASGHTVRLVDARYFANFGHLHFNGQDVMMPFWVNSQIALPGSGPSWLPAWFPGSARPLLVPVSHAEYEWIIDGPRLRAAVSFYFGIDGKAEFRTMDQLDQPWVQVRDAHAYAASDGLEVTRLAGRMVVAYLHLHQAHPLIPFGGYYAFGVCQDVVAAIELKMTGQTTLFPNTADDRFFTDPRDREINQLIRRLPKDRYGQAPDVARIFGSLPVGSSDAELAQVSIPGLGAQLVSVHDAWSAGRLHRTLSGRRLWLRYAAVLLALAVIAVLLGWWRHRSQARGGKVQPA